MGLFSSRQLIAHLKVFAKFTNPRSLYMESSLSELYNQVILKLHTHTLLLNNTNIRAA